jgi:hypothetical protein
LLGEIIQHRAWFLGGFPKKTKKQKKKKENPWRIEAQEY